jgi:F-type H+-transporting ATPase subunit b
LAGAYAAMAYYENMLRDARAAVFKAAEAKRQAALQSRAEAVAQARTKAQAQVEAAKKDIESDRETAQSGLQGESAALAQEIMRRVLQPAGAGR